MAVPWTSIIRWAPQLVMLSRELMQRAGRSDDDSDDETDRRVVPSEDRKELLIRIAALEENERNQAALIERMAQHQAEMAKGVLALHRRERVFAVAFVVLLGLVVWALLR